MRLLWQMEHTAEKSRSLPNRCPSRGAIRALNVVQGPSGEPCQFHLRPHNTVPAPSAGMPPILLKEAKQASPWMMLCGVSVVFNSLGDVLGLMCSKCSSENGQVLVGFQSTEAFGCLHHAGGGPAQRHRGVSPSLHVATDAAHGPHHVLN